MLTHGGDRARRAGERVILQSAIPKGWTAREPKTNTSPEHPGTAVLWDEEYFEVVEASASPSGGVRYVLMAWRDEHAIRTLSHYDAESEALRLEDHQRVMRQRKASFAASLSGIVLGHLPADVQNHLENELGVRATRLTLISCIPPVVILGFCLLGHVEAVKQQQLSPIPIIVWPIIALLAFESFIRFFVVMSQGRPMGTSLGFLGYAIYRLVSGKGMPAPARGASVAFIEPTEDVALRGSFEIKEPLLTLLSPAEQSKLAERFGFNYRRTASVVASVILAAAAIGAITSESPLAMLIAAAVAVEQAVRLVALRRGPVASIFAPLVRPFARNLLR
ncbi:MAG TPA: hypothetical protein VEK79_22340 [Thermoanaerobaculia bacterium]|nr:hypothetical protein [Thermoanaerobaculia bacterium]